MPRIKVMLWLDDVRDPFTGDWVLQYDPDYFYEKDTHKIAWVKTYDEYVKWIEAHGLPDKIQFDHDLGEGSRTKSGMDAAKWLVNYCIDKNVSLPDWDIQSANPVGAKNISSLLLNFAEKG